MISYDIQERGKKGKREARRLNGHRNTEEEKKKLGGMITISRGVQRNSKAQGTRRYQHNGKGKVKKGQELVTKEGQRCCVKKTKLKGGKISLVPRAGEKTKGKDTGT